MTQFPENARTDRRTEGQTHPILQDPSGYHRGSDNIFHIFLINSCFRYYSIFFSLSKIAHPTPIYDFHPLFGIHPHFIDFFVTRPHPPHGLLWGSPIPPSQRG